MKFTQLRKSIRYALSGLRYVFRNEQNFRIQIIATVFVLLLSYFFEVRKYEFIVLILLSFVVMSLELVNSSLEKFFDVVNPRLKDQVRVAKDIMAGAVLFASLFAGLVGLIIFWPYFFG